MFNTEKDIRKTGEIHKKEIRQLEKIMKDMDTVHKEKIDEEIDMKRNRHSANAKNKRDKMRKKFMKETWLMVDAGISFSNKRRLYKVSVDFSSYTSIDQSDLHHYKEHYCVHVAIGDLKCLKLCINNSESSFNYFQSDDNDIKYITLFE